MALLDWHLPYPFKKTNLNDTKTEVHRKIKTYEQNNKVMSLGICLTQLP